MIFICVFLFSLFQTTEGTLWHAGKSSGSIIGGFGFILQDSGQDVFVHHTVIDGDGFKTLHEGDVVNYELIPGEKGPRAGNVQRVLCSDRD